MIHLLQERPLKFKPSLRIVKNGCGCVFQITFFKNLKSLKLGCYGRPTAKLDRDYYLECTIIGFISLLFS